MFGQVSVSLFSIEKIFRSSTQDRARCIQHAKQQSCIRSQNPTQSHPVYPIILKIPIIPPWMKKKRKKNVAGIRLRAIMHIFRRSSAPLNEVDSV